MARHYDDPITVRIHAAESAKRTVLEQSVAETVALFDRIAACDLEGVKPEEADIQAMVALVQERLPAGMGVFSPRQGERISPAELEMVRDASKQILATRRALADECEILATGGLPAEVQESISAVRRELWEVGEPIRKRLQDLLDALERSIAAEQKRSQLRTRLAQLQRQSWLHALVQFDETRPEPGAVSGVELKIPSP